MFIEFLRPFFGDSIKVIDNNKVKEISLEEALNTSYNDISLIDRYLQSMADSSDPLNKMFDSVVKSVKEDARLATIEIEKEIKSLALKLEKSGYDNTEFMYERDSEGNLTGNYISEFNMGEYEKQRRLFENKLKETYGENPEDIAKISYNRMQV